MNAVGQPVLSSSAGNLSFPIPGNMPYTGASSDAKTDVNSHVNNVLILNNSSSVSLPDNSTSHSSLAAASESYSSASASNTSSTVAVQKDVCGTTYFYTPGEYDVQATDQIADSGHIPHSTVFPGCLPHVAHMKLKSNQPSFFISDDLKLDILNRQIFTSLHMDDSQRAGCPREIDNYHELYPLESQITPHSVHKSNTFGYHTTVYKAINSKDNLTYCLRRIHGYRLVNKCMTAIEQWKKIQHPNLIHLREVFTTKAFSDQSMVFVYDFHPTAETLMERHFGSVPVSVQQPGFVAGNSSPFRHSGSNSSLLSQTASQMQLPESLIWTYVVQLSSILRAVHAHGLACRVMDPTKILLTDSKTRIRLNCVGIFDVLSYDSNLPNSPSQMDHYQQEDLVSLGRVILALANNSLSSLQNLQGAMMMVSRAYSTDLKNLILYLMTSQARPRSINDIMPMIGARFYSQLEVSHNINDALENELSKEIENGRLFKLVCKLGTINERPQYNKDAAWSETGDRYMLKLFRDYLFHQVDETGAPWIDMAHIIQCLNKLNAGVSEKICMSSRDDDIVLIVSYAELKRCVETAYAELSQQSQPNRSPTMYS